MKLSITWKQSFEQEHRKPLSNDNKNLSTNLLNHGFE